MKPYWSLEHIVSLVAWLLLLVATFAFILGLLPTWQMMAAWVAMLIVAVDMTQ
jgi:hypothetical protein